MEPRTLLPKTNLKNVQQREDIFMTQGTTRRNFLKMGAGAASVLPFLRAMPAAAQGSDTMVVVIGETINSLDLHRSGTSRAAYQVGINCYDRLVSFGTKEAIGPHGW